MKLVNGLGILLALAVLTAPLTASGQLIGLIDPEEGQLDFGPVRYGESAQRDIVIINSDDAGEDLVLTGFRLAADCDDGFAVETDIPDFGIPDGGFFHIAVRFEPVGLGDHSCSLVISSNALDYPVLLISMFGEGVAGEPASVLMAELLSFWEDNPFVGDGPNERAASNRLRAFGSMLYAADDLIAAGDDEWACDQLTSAYYKVDEDPTPPDFIVDSPEKTALRGMILGVIDALGCP